MNKKKGMGSPYSFKPQLSKKSLKMASKLGNVMDRLTRPNRTSKSPISRNQSSKYLYPKTPDSGSVSKTFISYQNQSYEFSTDANASFHPTINSKSKQIDKRSKSPMGMNRFEQLYLHKGNISIH